MRVAVDASIVEVDRAGSGTYARELLRHLPGSPGVDSVVELASGVGSGGAAGKARWLYQDLVWAPRRLGRLAAAAGADLLHCPAYRGPFDAPLPVVVTIHDVYPLVNPRAFRAWWRYYFRWGVRRVARASRRIITSSEFSAGEIVNRWGIDRDRIRTIHCGVGRAFRRHLDDGTVAEVLERHGLRPGYYLFVGSLEPRKNLDGVIRAGQLLRERGRDVRVVVVGPAGWRNRSLKRQLGDAVDEGWARRLGYVPDADLAALYRGALALTYPSHYEGFGFPAVEAMASACPVIASRGGSLPEIVGDAGLLVDSADVGELAAAMERLGREPELASELRARGRERARRFDWERCVAETVEVYREVLGGG